MDMTSLIQAIQSVGFPIVCCGTLFWYMAQQDEKHDVEIRELTRTIQNNTLALTRLCDKLGVDLKDE